MIIPELNIAFIHNPKAAGKSVEHMLLSHLLGRETSGPLGAQPADIKQKYHLEGPAERHSPASAYDQKYKFSVVRDPLDRFASAYYWHLRVTPYKQHNPTFNQFIEGTKQRLVNPQLNKDPVWFHVQPQVYYIDDSVEDVLRFETITTDIEKIRKKFKITTTLGWHNKTKQKRSKLYTEENIEIVTNWYKDDFKYFEYDLDESIRKIVGES